MAGQTVGRPWWLLGWVVTGLVVVVAASAVAAGGRVGAAERAVFEAVNGLPDALRWPMWVFQLLGLLLIPLAVAAIALARRRIRLAVALVALVPLKLLAEKAVIKDVVCGAAAGIVLGALLAYAVGIPERRRAEVLT